jgi:hypothetical protein
MTATHLKLTDKELQSLRNLGNESEAAADEIVRLRGEQAVLVRLLVQCDGVLSVLEGESVDEQERLDALSRAILAATIPHRPEEADLFSVRACLGA